MTVLNSLVGRIIGRGGSKINSIQVRNGSPFCVHGHFACGCECDDPLPDMQVSSGAHINVSRNIPKSTERLITIKVGFVWCW